MEDLEVLEVEHDKLTHKHYVEEQVIHLLKTLLKVIQVVIHQLV